MDKKNRKKKNTRAYKNSMIIWINEQIKVKILGDVKQRIGRTICIYL